jgi:hypothetical protein
LTHRNTTGRGVTNVGLVFASERSQQSLEQRRESQRDRIEGAIAGRNAAWRVSERHVRAEHIGLPMPGAHARPVDLEQRDDEEHAREEHGLAAAHEDADEDDHRQRAADVGTRSEHEREHGPRDAAGDGGVHGAARVRAHEGAARQAVAGEVDEPVPGWDEGGDPTAPIGVEPEDERAEDLAARRDEDHACDLRALAGRERSQGGDEDEPRRRSDGELSGVAGERLDEEGQPDVAERGGAEQHARAGLLKAS